MADLCFVVPVYKVPYNYLHLCIQSILKQIYSNIELILVDDGSPDDCGKICDEYAGKDERVKVVHKKNGGLSDARNAGIRVATAPWITFVDGDDWVDLDFSQYFLDIINKQEKKADFYIFSGYRNYSNREIVCTPYYDEGTRFETYDEREKLQIECCMVPTKKEGARFFIGSACGKVYSLEYIRKNDLYFTIVPYGEDSIYYLHSIENATCVEYESRNIYHYRDTEGSMVNKFRSNADNEQDIYLKELFEFAKKYQKKESFIDALYYRVFISMQRCVRQKFYNKQNPVSIKEKAIQCNSFFSKEPYASVYKHVDYRKLNRNNKYKYMLMRLRLYKLLSESHGFFNVFYGKVSQKR